jgi:zinc/manganese transport system substrate-binding protein
MTVKAIVAAVLLFVPLVAHAKVNVVATVSDLAAIAREVGGDAVQVETLARPTQDPHFTDAKPNLVLMLARADLLLVNGMELEVGWLPALLTGSRNGRLQPGSAGYLDCSTLVTPKEVPKMKLDRSMGDVHPGGNPHYTKDPTNALILARAIANQLSEIDHAHAEQYRKGAAAFEQALGAHLTRWRQALAPFKGVPVVTYHKSWIYFVEWAGLEEVAFIEPKPGIPPNPTHIANVLAVIRARSVPVMIQEEWYSAQTSELLARNSGARLVRVPGMTPEGQSYIQYMDRLVAAVVSGLSAKAG